MRKVFELLIKPWLVESVRETKDLGDDQKGFQDGHSTIEAIRRVVGTHEETRKDNRTSRQIVILATLDVKTHSTLLGGWTSLGR